MAASTMAGRSPWNTIRCSPSWPSGPTPREDATARMIRALREYDVGGIRTNIGFFRQILEDADSARGNLHTGFIEEFFARHRAPQAPRDLADGGRSGRGPPHAGAQRQRRGASRGCPQSSAWQEAGQERACCDETHTTHQRRRRDHRILGPRAHLPLPAGRAPERARQRRNARAGRLFRAAGRPHYDARVEEHPPAWWW